jgi:hypothetical protein
MPFQGHRCPGPDFKAEKGKNAVFSRNSLLEMAFLPFSTIYNIFFDIFVDLISIFFYNKIKYCRRYLNVPYTRRKWKAGTGKK